MAASAAAAWRRRTGEDQQRKLVADRQALTVAIQCVLGPAFECFVAVLLRKTVVIVIGQIQIEERILVKTPELVDVADRQFILQLKRTHAMLRPEMQRDATAAEFYFLGKFLPDIAQQNVDRRIRGLGSQSAEPAVGRLARH